MKITLPSYRGPDRPGPLMGLIRAIRFHLSNIDPDGKLSTNILLGENSNGSVRVERVNGIDYINVWSGERKEFRIVYFPDDARWYYTKVNLGKDKYTFNPMRKFSGGPFTFYEFDYNYANLFGKQQVGFLPYIVKKNNDTWNYASNGPPGDLLFMDQYEEWNQLFYTIDCTAAQSNLTSIWKPPLQTLVKAFGVELTPPWYSCSLTTAHNYHPCYERGIDQEKRKYSPYNTSIILPNSDLRCDLNILQHSGNFYNFRYMPRTGVYYGKNAYRIQDGEITEFAGAIQLDGAIAKTCPVDIDPIFYFWPWIPYLDEIRLFNILAYAFKNSWDGASGWYMTPDLDSFKSWKTAYYNSASGKVSYTQLFEDSGSFSNITRNTSQSEEDSPEDCICGECDAGVYTTESTTTVSEYSSSGERYTPIGLFDFNQVISMKTTWRQEGSGPVVTTNSEEVTTGNYPYDFFIYNNGQLVFNYCCGESGLGILAYNGAQTKTVTASESAVNSCEIKQVLTVGNDIIFEGDSLMTYELSREYNFNASGNISTTVEPECRIMYTKTTMGLGTSQTLQSIGPCAPTWSVRGLGTITPTDDPRIAVYTAPATMANPNPELGCDKDYIDLSCEYGSDTLAIDITYANGYAARKNSFNWCYWELGYVSYGYSIYWILCDGRFYKQGDFSSWRSCPGGRSHEAECCYGASEQVCGEGGYSAAQSSAVIDTEGAPVPVFAFCSTYADQRTLAQITAGCCPTIYPVNPTQVAPWWGGSNPPEGSDPYSHPPY
jgi:hypothetical protein